MACSAKKCENLLVDVYIDCHFRGLILCNAKCLQFYQNKKNNIGAQFSKSFIPLCRIFFIDEVVVSVHIAQFVSLFATATLSVLMVAE